MWKTIDKVLHKTSGTTAISELKDGDTIVKGQNQIAEKLNEHFVSIDPKLASKLEVKPDDDPIKYLHPTDSNQKFSFKLMNEESMLRSLKMLKSGKASGRNGVPTNLVKDAMKFIAKPLTMIFNASLAMGIVPNVWKLELEMKKIVTGQFLFSQFLQNYLKRLCMTSYPISFFLTGN